MTASVPIVSLGSTGVDTTVLGFGCADLFREPDPDRRRLLLETAYDHGIRHFDMAPMYGLGDVEAEIGRFARGRRDRLVLATKFGIEVTGAGRLVARVQAPIQRAARRSTEVSGRTVAGAGADARAGVRGRLLYRPGCYTPQAARASLERSLRRLGTDYLDLFFVHDPRPDDRVPDDLAAYLESVRRMGHIRSWGVAGEVTAVRASAPSFLEAPVVQLRRDLFAPTAPSAIGRDSALIVYGALARALPRLLEGIRSRADLRQQWQAITGTDHARPDDVARLLLAEALAANPRGAVLFSSGRPARIAAAASVAAAGVEPGVIEGVRHLAWACGATGAAS